MSFYRDRIYPHLVNRLGNPEPIRRVRQQIIPLAEGKVLEIGAGSGANFPLYDPAKVSEFYALEPNPRMIRLAERLRQRARLDLAIQYLDLPGEHIPLADETIDTVVSAFTLCTIPGVADAILEVTRVLRPGGKLIYYELTRSPDPRVERWQHRWEPFQHRIYAGLYLTRDIPSLLNEGGLQIERNSMGYLTPFPKSWAHCCWGVAIKPPR